MSDTAPRHADDVRYGIELFRIARAMRATRPTFCDRVEAGDPFHTGSQRAHGLVGGWMACCLGLADMLIDMGLPDKAVLIDFLEQCGAWPLFRSGAIEHLFSPWGTLTKASEASKPDEIDKTT